ncbi:MAG: hypothetical protein AAGC68_06370 [Verrucomicrobiota bacterium]
MSTDPNTEETLEAYGYGRKGSAKNWIIVLLSILLVGATAAAIILGTFWSRNQSELLTTRQKLDEFTTRVSGLENKNAELSSLLADKQAQLARLQEEWTTEVETMKKEHNEQLQRTYAQLNEIVYDTKGTLSYIGDVESRLREGRDLNLEEAAQLKSVVNGLVFLHEQYKKPLNEFRELSRYFNQQLSRLPADAVDPIETTPLGKRIFQNRKFKEERAQFFENQGRRSALSGAKQQVEAAYASAQRQMSSVSLDINEYLASLENIIESNENSAASVDEFFEKSKAILKIHDEIMQIEPDSEPTVKP